MQQKVFIKSFGTLNQSFEPPRSSTIWIAHLPWRPHRSEFTLTSDFSLLLAAPNNPQYPHIHMIVGIGPLSYHGTLPKWLAQVVIYVHWTIQTKDFLITLPMWDMWVVTKLIVEVFKSLRSFVKLVIHILARAMWIGSFAKRAKLEFIV